MDKKIAVHFFSVAPRHDGVPRLANVLAAALDLAPTPGGRELAVSQDVIVRLERMTNNGDWIEGEFTRVQTDNIPMEAVQAGLIPSRAENQGHSAVFRFHEEQRLLIVQRNTSGMTVSRFFRYLRTVNETARYEAQPLPAPDMWGRFDRQVAKRFSMTLSGVGDPANIEGEAGALVDASRTLGHALNGPTVHIAISAGGNPQGLNKNVLRGMLRGLFGVQDPQMEVTTLSVSAEDEHGEGSDIINFLDDVLKDSGELDLNGLNGEESYSRRMELLRSCYAEQMDYIATLQ